MLLRSIDPKLIPIQTLRMDASATCEACRRAAVTTSIDDADSATPYRLCAPCAEKLQLYALRPIEWFNLAATHGWQRYMLHDDFYDHDGEATQPEIDDYSSIGFEAPTLDRAKQSLPDLVDFCVAQWSLTPEIFAAFQPYSHLAILREIERRAERGNRNILEAMLAICANTLARTGTGWVRAQYPRARQENLLFAWCEAAAKCLPETAGLELAIAALHGLEDRQIRNARSGLLWFRSNKVLDWIELNAPVANVKGDWGQLAALSDLDLARVQKWILAGRPLSLIALDALSELIPRPSLSPITRTLAPALRGCADRSLILPLLDMAMIRDPAPRISNIVRFIAGNIGAMRIETR